LDEVPLQERDLSEAPFEEDFAVLEQGFEEVAETAGSGERSRPSAGGWAEGTEAWLDF
jgi:hypothetical protein